MSFASAVGLQTLSHSDPLHPNWRQIESRGKLLSPVFDLMLASYEPTSGLLLYQVLARSKRATASGYGLHGISVTAAGRVLYCNDKWQEQHIEKPQETKPRRTEACNTASGVCHR